MSHLHRTISQLEFAQVCWVVPDIEAAVTFLSSTIGVGGFHAPMHMRAQDLQMSYHNRVVEAEWLTTQAYNGRTFIEIVQPLSGTSMFHDYLAQHPMGGIQHVAFRLPVERFEEVTAQLTAHGFPIISRVDHPIARMAFFNTYRPLGVATEIMGVTPDGWAAISGMER